MAESVLTDLWPGVMLRAQVHVSVEQISRCHIHARIGTPFILEQSRIDILICSRIDPALAMKFGISLHWI